MPMSACGPLTDFAMLGFRCKNQELRTARFQAKNGGEAEGRSMESSVLASTSLTDLYRAYIDCLNRQDWDELGQYVDDEVEHNGRPLKLSGYRDMLVHDFEDIPDLRFNIQLLLSSPPFVAARLAFRCSPKGKFLGLSVSGRMLSFAENVFY